MNARMVVGPLCLSTGLLPLIAVANPVLLDTWSVEPAQAMTIYAEHHGAWLFTTWFLAAGFAMSIPAVVVLASLLDSLLARIAAVAHLLATTLLAISWVFNLTISQALFGKPLPDWYLPVSSWNDGLDTTALGLLWPVAQVCFGIVVLSTHVLPRWSGWVLIAAGTCVLAQLAVLGGVIPAPLFIAFVAVGIAAILRRRRERLAVAVPSVATAAGH
jgi:hypothetical protein